MTQSLSGTVPVLTASQLFGFVPVLIIESVP